MKPDILGKYIHKKTGSHYLELKPDETYFLFEGSAGVTGTYEVNGAEITLLGPDSTSTARIQDGVITDAEGDKWVRAKLKTSSDDPLDSITWLPAILKRDLPWELFEAGGWVIVLVLVSIFVVNARP